MSRMPNIKELEDAKVVSKLIEAIEKNPKAHPKNFIPDPSTSMILLMDAMSRSIPCMDMLGAKKCDDFKRKRELCEQELRFKYGVLLTHGFDFQGALNEELFERISNAKKAKACCSKK